MKLFTRIMVVLMALVLVLGVSVASAAPGNLSQIEGLPECPEVPSMKVKSVGGTTTITLSEPLSWLQVVRNWNWLDIIQWNEDKTVGTYVNSDLPSAPGAGNWNNEWTSEWEQGAKDPATWERTNEYWGYSFDENSGIATHQYFSTYLNDDNIEIGHLRGQMFGHYDPGFAYDGGIADGSDVKYTAGGKIASITVSKTGVNYLGSEKEPVKTEVTFNRMYGRMYISTIKETYDDDTTCEAHYNFNGVLTGVK